MIYDRGAQEIEIEVRLVTDIVRWLALMSVSRNHHFTLHARLQKWFAQEVACPLFSAVALWWWWCVCV
jgi:hypothetical protein